MRNKVTLIPNHYLILLFCPLFFLTGCLEANFNLASDSRLPKFIKAPAGVSRNELHVTLDSYSDSKGGYEVFRVYRNNQFFSIDKIEIANIHGPFRLRNQFNSEYPFYVVVEINGITDIVEHKRKDDVIYMVDDPAVWKELGVENK